MTIPLFAIAILVASTVKENLGKLKHPKPNVLERLFSYSRSKSWYAKA